MFKQVTMNGGNTISKSFLALLCMLAFAARTSRTNEVCSEFFYLGGKFGTHTGSFSSPGYPSGTYPSRERCTWIVKVPMDYRVGLYFSDFDIEYCPFKEQNCTCDYVEITDGQLRIDRLLAKFCGSETPPTVYSSGQFVRVDLVSDESKTRKGFQAHFYSISPDGVTPNSGVDVDTDKNQKSVPTPTGLPKEGGNSTVMIAVICSLLGVVVIGLILLFIYCKKRTPPQERQPRPAQLQMASPVSNALQRNHAAQLPSESPPPYSSVVATAPPPYPMPSRPTHTK